jgi:hypothetical protein
LEIAVNPPPPDALGVSVNQLLDTGQPPIMTDKEAALRLHEETGISVGGLEDAGDAIDRTDVVSVQARLNQLKDKISDAEELGNLEEKETLEEEAINLVKYLKSNLNHKGKPRKIGGAHEKIRKAVSAAVSRAITNIKIGHPDLGKHLEESIGTGSYCSYIPFPINDWKITIVNSRQAK